MRLNARLKAQRYETIAQERSAERKAERKQAERLSAILKKKADSRTKSTDSAA
jgi:NMD protein affecting ribosome stability and mRNA decay